MLVFTDCERSVNASAFKKAVNAVVIEIVVATAAAVRVLIN
jgi:hypothetical protein